MTYEQYAQNVYGSTECDAGRDKVALSSRTAEALGVAGTPTFMNSSGDLVMGFSTADLNVLIR
jgi:protein-disulfide isomerase